MARLIYRHNATMPLLLVAVMVTSLAAPALARPMLLNCHGWLFARQAWLKSLCQSMQRQPVPAPPQRQRQQPANRVATANTAGTSPPTTAPGYGACQYTRWSSWKPVRFSPYRFMLHCAAGPAIVHERKRQQATGTSQQPCPGPLRVEKLTCLPTISQQMRMLQAVFGSTFQGEALPPTTFRPRETGDSTEVGSRARRALTGTNFFQTLTRKGFLAKKKPKTSCPEWSPQLARDNGEGGSNRPEQLTGQPSAAATAQGNPRDIAIVLDASGSIGKSNFIKTVQNLAELVSSLCYGWTGAGQASDVRLAMVVFSTTVQTVFDFRASARRHTNASAIRDSILRAQDLWPCMGGVTATGPALQLCRDGVFTAAAGMRNVSTKRIVLITDGKSNKGPKPVPIGRALHHASNIDIFPIGVTTDVNLKELHRLRLVSETDGPLSQLLVLPGFDSLTEIVGQVRANRRAEKVCSANLRPQP